MKKKNLLEFNLCSVNRRTRVGSPSATKEERCLLLTHAKSNCIHWVPIK